MKKSNSASFSQRSAELTGDLKNGKFAPCYLVYGEQAYLRLQYRDRIVDALMGEGDRTMNLTRFFGKDFSARTLIDLSQTMPFFAERRVIVLEETGLFAKDMEKEADLLNDYIKEGTGSTVFVFVQSDPDTKRKLFKTVDSLGTAFLCDTPEPDMLVRWCAGRFKSAGVAIEPRTLSVFVNRVGTDMMSLAGEVEKLISFCAEKHRVEESDIDAISSVYTPDRIFELISAIASRDTGRAVGIYRDMEKLGTPVQVILSLLLRQYNILIMLQEGMGKGLSYFELARQLHVPEFAIRKDYRPTLQKLRRGDLLRALEACIQADTAYKSGRITDKLAVETLLVELSG